MLRLGTQGYCSGFLNDGSMIYGEQIMKVKYFPISSVYHTVIILLIYTNCIYLQNTTKNLSYRILSEVSEDVLK